MCLVSSIFSVRTRGLNEVRLRSFWKLVDIGFSLVSAGGFSEFKFELSDGSRQH